ncbi:MAG: hypothetical protein ACPL0A_01370 [Candidatus Micrarchaeia archaeon]
MEGEVVSGYFGGNIIGRIKREKSSIKSALVWLDAKEEEVLDSPLPTLTKEKLLFLIKLLKIKLSRHSKELEKGDCGPALDEDFKYIKLLLGDPLEDYKRKSAGVDEREKSVNALFMWMEGEILLPSDSQIEMIKERIKGIDSDLSILDEREMVQFRKLVSYRAKRLTSLVDEREKKLKELKDMLNRYI